MIADEKILLRQLKEGSHQAFQRLYESYFDCFMVLFFVSPGLMDLQRRLYKSHFQKFGIVILELYPKNPLKHGYLRLEKMK